MLDGMAEHEPNLKRDAGPERNETPAERSDRNWVELLQELRVAQTGIQILTGFLLTLPFQPAFAELDSFQRATYLSLVVLACLSTASLLAPVSLHRFLFQRHLKEELVRSADRIARVGLLLVGLVVAGTALLIFDVVLNRGAGLVVAGSILAALVLFWAVLPWRAIRRHATN